MTTYIESKLKPDGRTYDHSEVIDAHKKGAKVEVEIGDLGMRSVVTPSFLIQRKYRAVLEDKPPTAEPLDRERPTVPSNIAYLIEQYGNARADDDTTSTAYSALIVGLRGWAASLVDREAIRNAALEEAANTTFNAPITADMLDSDDAKAVALHAASRISHLKSQLGQQITASEAVYGFAGWLTTREESVTFSSKHDAAVVAELVEIFIKNQGLAAPRENYTERLRVVEQPVQPSACETCGGSGWLGGPSFYSPDEGGVPCGDCAQPSGDSGELPSDKDLLEFGGNEQFFLFCSEDEFLDIAKAVLRRFGSAQPSDSHGLDDNMRSFIEGMSVSIDVSTGAHDVDHRLFGTVSEVMDSGSDKHGVILLVHDQKPNFKPSDSQAGPSDTDMFDWLLSKIVASYAVRMGLPTNREAIKAAMKAEKEGS